MTVPSPFSRYCDEFFDEQRLQFSQVPTGVFPSMASLNDKVISGHVIIDLRRPTYQYQPGLQNQSHSSVTWKPLF